MSSKKELLRNLRDILDAWEAMLQSNRAHEIAAHRQPAEWSIRQVIAHLRAWQQISIARIQAARLNTEPVLPEWLSGADPFYAEDHVDEFNKAIQETYVGRSWESIHQEWRDGYLRFLDLAAAIPEPVIFDPKRFPWLRGYPLSAVLEGSWDHHKEHLAACSEPPS